MQGPHPSHDSIGLAEKKNHVTVLLIDVTAIQINVYPVVGLDDIEGPFQPWLFCDFVKSEIQFFFFYHVEEYNIGTFRDIKLYFE